MAPAKKTFSKQEILDALHAGGSSTKAGLVLGCSVYVVARLKEEFGIEFNGTKQPGFCPKTPEHCRKISQAKLGVKPSLKTRRKMSRTRRRKYRSGELKHPMQKYDLTEEQIRSALKEFNSQAKAAKYLGVSQMTVSRAKRKFKIDHSGRPLANRDSDKIMHQSNAMKAKFASGELVPYWLGKKLSAEHVEKRVSKMRGKPTWNSGSKVVKISICEIDECKKEFPHSPHRNRRFCSPKCSAIHMSRQYSDGRLVGDKNPNFGNGQAIIAARKRGCYKDMKLPKHTTANGGYHDGIWMRSSWEIAFASLLDKNSIGWQYEKKRFLLSSGKTYVPDFFIPNHKLFVEVKGHWFENAWLKFRDFVSEYEDQRIVVIDFQVWKDPVKNFELFLLTAADYQMSLNKILTMS